MFTTLTAPLPAPSTVLYALLGVLALGLATVLYLYPYTARTIPFRNLPGPEPASALFGSLLTQQRAEPGTTYSKWAAAYGPTLRFRSILGSWRIVSTDLRAAAWVLQHTGQFHRQTGFNAMLDRMFGRGVLMVEDAAHRRQRRVLAPAFSAVNVANMMPVFWDKAYELDKKLAQVVSDGEKGGAQVDIHLYFMRTALDIIGLAGFNYDFGAADEADNPLSKSMFAATNGIQKPSIVRVLQIFYPALLPLPTRFTRTLDSNRRIQDKVAREIVAARKAELHDVKVEKKADIGKDAISLLIKANMSPDLEERQRLTDEEVLGQIGSLVLAGNETSATALAWTCLHLTQHPEVQVRLRDELDGVPEDRPSMEELHALSYLDSVVHEVLRYDPPLPQVVRMCVQDTIVPLSQPVKGVDGKLMSEIAVSKGTEFVIPINEINRSKEVWGPDADKFNPDRFERAPGATVPGVWGNLVTFNAGPHNCMGYRFALAEIKVMLFVLLRNYTLEALPSNPRIERRGQGFVQRPFVVGEEDKGIQLPVILRRREV
ncbi:Cytochrome P450 monooxygenase FUM15 [Vanrija pseudolonga]|uniref:Cytochrome P450 monooxygenase FUM15 n=1 Tax=Vanrija pseudolonga TaxID=143232 RepID=A0AAF0YEB1_9TREE|nr:Cytochrome P450 monooxygenase FUM15 [Vanrija pseudolonga]